MEFEQWWESTGKHTSNHRGIARRAWEAAQKNVKEPSFEEVKADLSNRYQIGDDDDCENCEEHMRRVYKATLKLMGLEQTDGK